MENASKALIMAGSVLIAILVIRMLIYGYNQLSDAERTTDNAQLTDQLAEYMRQFEQFNRTLYGSELLSLANLQEDYNTSEAREDSGYDEVEITVQITKSIVNSNYFKAGSYNLEAIKEDRDRLTTEVAKYEQNERTYNNRSVKYYASKTYREIALDFGMTPSSNSPEYEIQETLMENATTQALLAEIQE